MTPFKLLDSGHRPASKPLLSKALLKLSGNCGLHPTCFALDGLEKLGQQVAGGGYGDVWKGRIGGQTVAVKSMRQFQEQDIAASLKVCFREALIWRQLSHPNLLPFLGLYTLDSRLCLISPWMDNGDLKSFLRNPPAGTDRLSLIVDVAMGLNHLHGENVVHGDLKAPNILVTPSGRACITDFGLSSIVGVLALNTTLSNRSGRPGTLRYQAPELLLDQRPNHFGSDVYAFACLCYEVG
ncbi:kinase-like domain-containing protein [Mycena filopes]|nr:kinase-like domain-containing protein [Mycena filopes]